MKRNLLIAAIIIASCVVLPFNDYAADQIGEEIKIYMGDVEVLPVNNPIRIVIANPLVADVTQVSKNEATITPKSPGKTTLVVWDSYGEQSYQITVIHENMTEVKRRIDKMLSKLDLPNVYTQAEDEEDRVILLGKVKTAAEKDKIFIALGPLKAKTVDLITLKEEEAAIDIEVQILELNQDASRTLGFSVPGTLTLTDVSAPITTGTTGLLNILHVSDFTRTGFNFTLDALVQEGKARVLSRPRLACQSGREAELLVGGEKPIFTTSVQATVGTSTNVQYKEYGIKLKVRPTITEEKRIKLALSVEVSEVGAVDSIGAVDAPTAKAYPLTKRNISTEVYMNDNQTLAIGGLMKRKEEEDYRKTPLLGDVPVLGMLFRKKSVKVGGGSGERADIELFITLTPSIVPTKNVPEAKKDTRLKPALAAASIDTNIPESLRGYTSIVQKRILDNLKYPAAAKESGFQGTVKLNLHLSYLGELLDVAVKSSSGYQILDDNAIYIAKSISSYPPFPSSLEQKELWVEVPIVYRLD